MKNTIKHLVASTLILAFIFISTPQNVEAVQIDAFGTLNGTPVTGVDVSSSTTALDVNLATDLAGERNPDSAVNSYIVVRDEVNMTIISTTSTSTIGGGSAGDTHLVGLHISTALTGVCVIAGFGDTTGTSTSFIMPAGSVGYKEFKGAKNNIGALTVTCPTTGDDNFVAVFWRPV
jgi:hypothetical protein